MHQNKVLIHALIHAPKYLIKSQEKPTQTQWITWKLEWKKPWRERGENSTIIKVITMGFFGVLEFLNSILSRWKGFSIHTVCICFDKAAKFIFIW